MYLKIKQGVQITSGGKLPFSVLFLLEHIVTSLPKMCYAFIRHQNTDVTLYWRHDTLKGVVLSSILTKMLQRYEPPKKHYGVIRDPYPTPFMATLFSYKKVIEMDRAKCFFKYFGLVGAKSFLIRGLAEGQYV